MKNGSIFINSSRGEIVNEKELIRFLKKNKKSKAIIDVIQNEQSKELRKNILYDFSKRSNRLLITPHMAGLTFESETKAAIQTYNNLKQVLRGIKFDKTIISRY